MEARDQLFRQRLVAFMAALNGGEAKDVELRRAVGLFAYRLAKNAGARNWSDLKTRLDAAGYDALLQKLTEQTEVQQNAGDQVSVRAIEALTLSLVARYQRQGDLVPGVGFLDRFIESCASLVKPAAKVVVSNPTPARGKH
jgi:hypothetical protein